MNDRPDARTRILDSTAALLERLGPEDMSIRDVCQAAEVTTPTVYHHFGDKKGLLRAVSTEGFERYLKAKRQRHTSSDPVADLRLAWENHIGFGLEHPAFYRLMFGVRNAEESRPEQEAHEMLLGLLTRLAEVGRLRVPPKEAATTIRTAAVGTTLTLLTTPDAPGADKLIDRMREGVFGVVLHDEHAADPSGTSELARTLFAALSAREPAALTMGERGILLELLSKLAS